MKSNKYGESSPFCQIGKNQYQICYRQIDQNYYLYRNGKEIMRSRNSDDLYRCLLRKETRYTGDFEGEIPRQYHTKLYQWQKQFGLVCQALPKEQPKPKRKRRTTSSTE